METSKFFLCESPNPHTTISGPVQSPAPALDFQERGDFSFCLLVHTQKRPAPRWALLGWAVGRERTVQTPRRRPRLSLPAPDHSWLSTFPSPPSSLTPLPSPPGTSRNPPLEPLPTGCLAWSPRSFQHLSMARSSSLCSNTSLQFLLPTPPCEHLQDTRSSRLNYSLPLPYFISEPAFSQTQAQQC